MIAETVAEIAGPVVYGTTGLVVARYRWTRDRPFRYPVSCTGQYTACSGPDSAHGPRCYMRNGHDAASASAKAALFGIFWGPLLVGGAAVAVVAAPFWAVIQAVNYRAPEFEEEKRWKEREGR